MQCGSKLQSSTGFLFLLGFYLIQPAADAARSDDRTEHFFSIPGDRQWTPTGLRLQKGEHLVIREITGRGGEPPAVSLQHSGLFGARNVHVTARGSYTVKTPERGFPLPSFLEDGPFPAYCLIGRLGDNGAPFYVGPHFDGPAQQSGELWLGINDPRPAGNRGNFSCSVILGNIPSERSKNVRRVVTEMGPPRPISDVNVVVFFIDGLRPDVAVEMAEMGHMPAFRELFLDGGVQLTNAFTLLPSLTLTSCASMLTGTFSDKHGTKMQFYFDRETGRYVDNLTNHAFGRIAAEIRRRDVKALYDYFPNSFGAGALPIQSRVPKALHANLVEWSHRGINEANYASRLDREIDLAQGRFGIDLASFPHVRVMLVWLPGTDVSSEKHPHGQFGASRRYVAGADEQIARVVEQLKRRGRFDNTYFVLFSDHGTVGGNGFVNEKFDVEREILHAHFALNTKGYYGALEYPGVPRRHFAAVWDTDGAVQVSLPYKRADSGDHSRPNFLADLQDYSLADGRRLNAVEVLAEFTSKGRWTSNPFHKPVDFAVARVDEDTCFIHRTNDSQALITRRRGADGELEFRYEPVREYRVGEPGKTIPSGDPLGYLDSEAFRKAVEREGSTVERWTGAYHTGREWLRVTAESEYPGNVDAISRFFHYDSKHSKPGEGDTLPDVALFAGRGWAFIPEVIMKSRGQEIAGTRHGMAFREAMRICAFFSGPGIHRNAIVEEPHRIIDILPTVLTMMSKDWKGHGLDGVPIDEIWSEEP